MATTEQARYVAVDVHYPPAGGAHAALVTALEPRFGQLAEERVRWLDITSAGIPVESAAALVAEMAGPYRLPDALRRVDTLARSRSG